ncbi:hypothetical protein C8R44DRAFT_978302 [Mycena epipterygia]|nr:hypothetical protein C8R44DRAFT_978302 [Mycena epipterygia]
MDPPIASLPVELLSYILVLATHDPVLPPNANASDDEPAFNTASVQAPLVFARVSRHWRRVALRTPALYTSLCITPELLSDADELDMSPILKYLALSRGCLLDVLVDARDPEWNFEYDVGAYITPAHITAALAVLLPHLPRWRSLTILTDLDAPMAAALRPLEAHLLKYGAPELRSLRLMRCDAYAPPFEGEAFLSSLADDAGCANMGKPLLPALTHLSLVGVPAAWGALASAVPPSLKTLNLSYLPAPTQPSLPELARLLSAAPGLTHLTVNGAGPALPSSLASASSGLRVPPSAFTSTNAYAPTSISHESEEPIALRALTSLTLAPTPSALALLSLLAGSAPALKRVILEDAGPDADVGEQAAVAPLISYLFPPSTSKDAPTTPFPALTSLTLHRPSAASVALALVLAPGAGAGAPLQEVVLRGVDPAGVLVQVAAAPFGAGGVKSLMLHEALYPNEEGEEEGEEYEVGGMRVRVFRCAAGGGGREEWEGMDIEEEDDGEEYEEEGEGEDSEEDTLMGSEPDLDRDRDFNKTPTHAQFAIPHTAPIPFILPTTHFIHRVPRSHSHSQPRTRTMHMEEVYVEEERAEKTAHEWQVEEEAAFAPGGVFNDPVFDAVWA